MTRTCTRCGFTLPLGQFPAAKTDSWHWLCRSCWSIRPASCAAAIAVDGILRLRAIDALLYLGFIRTARLIASGATVWPSIRQLREGTGMPRQPLWWISLDADTIALLRMMLRVPELKRSPVPLRAA